MIDHSKAGPTPLNRLRVEVLPVIFGALVFGVASVSLSFSVAKQWAVKFQVQLANLPATVSGISGNIGPTLPVEVSHRVVERLASESFQLGVLKRKIPSVNKDHPEFILLNDSLVARAMDRPGLVEISLRTRDPSLGAEVARQIVDDMASTHELIRAPVVARMKEYRQATNQMMQENLTAAAEAEKSAIALAKPGAGFAQQVVFLGIAKDRQETALRLRELLFVIDEQLGAPKNVPTRLFEEIEVSRHPVFPKRWMWLFSGLVLGGLLGLAARILLRRFGTGKVRASL